MVSGMLLSLCRHRWWYPVGHDRVASEPEPAAAQHCSPAAQYSTLLALVWFYLTWLLLGLSEKVL